MALVGYVRSQKKGLPEFVPTVVDETLICCRFQGSCCLFVVRFSSLVIFLFFACSSNRCRSKFFNISMTTCWFSSTCRTWGGGGDRLSRPFDGFFSPLLLLHGSVQNRKNGREVGGRATGAPVSIAYTLLSFSSHTTRSDGAGRGEE